MSVTSPGAVPKSLLDHGHVTMVSLEPNLSIDDHGHKTVVPSYKTWLPKFDNGHRTMGIYL